MVGRLVSETDAFMHFARLVKQVLTWFDDQFVCYDAQSPDATFAQAQVENVKNLSNQAHSKLKESYGFLFLFYPGVCLFQ